MTKETANYAEFNTGLTDSSGHKIFGYLFRLNNRMRDFRFLYWGYCIADMRTNYKQGNLIFTRRIDARKFFTELASRAISENWGAIDAQEGLPFPILRSYIIHVLKKIKTDEPAKLALNKKMDMALFLLCPNFLFLFLLSQLSYHCLTQFCKQNLKGYQLKV